MAASGKHMKCGKTRWADDSASSCDDCFPTKFRKCGGRPRQLLEAPELEQWLRDLDCNRGIFLRYADILLRLSGGDLKAMASLYNETNDDLDHSIWNQISPDTLGHKLLLRKGFRSLHRAMNCPPSVVMRT